MSEKIDPRYNNYYEMSFSPKELLFVLFSKKNCPVCGEKLKKVKNTKECVGLESVRGLEYSQTVNMHHVKLQYKCEKCDHIYSFDELFEIHKNKNN